MRTIAIACPIQITHSFCTIASYAHKRSSHYVLSTRVVCTCLFAHGKLIRRATLLMRFTFVCTLFNLFFFLLTYAVSANAPHVIICVLRSPQRIDFRRRQVRHDTQPDGNASLSHNCFQPECAQP